MLWPLVLLSMLVSSLAFARPWNAKPPSRRVLAANEFGMAAMPDTLWELISGHLSLIDALALRCSCRAITTAIAQVCDKRMAHQHDEVIRWFPENVRWSVPMKVWAQVAWIEFRPEWLGSAGYIDRVQHQHMPGSSPFRCCYDTHGRLCLLMRRKDDVAVLFQRYTDLHSTWAFASKTLPIGGCRLSDSMVARMALWLCCDFADFSQ